MLAYVIVFCGGGLGAVLRHGVNLTAARLLGTTFPYGTLTVNVAGSLAMGLFVGYLAERFEPFRHARLLLAAGVLGGFTTFSAFSLDVALLYERGALSMAALYVLASVVVSVAALFLGLFVVRQIAWGPL